MDFGAIITQALRTTWQQRNLWFFGFLLALFGAGGGGLNYNSFSTPLNMQGMILGSVDPLTEIDLPMVEVLAIFASLLVMLWVLMGLAIRPMATSAILGMQQRQAEKQMTSLKIGWQFAWSRAAWHIFLIDILVGLAMLLFFSISFCAAMSPAALFMVDNPAVQILGGSAFAGLCCGWVIVATVAQLLTLPFIEMSRRYVVLAKMGAVKSIEQAYHLVRNNIKSFLLAVVINLVLTIGWRIISGALIWFVMLVGVFLPTMPLLSGTPIENLIFQLLFVMLLFILLAVLLVWLMLNGLFLVFQLAYWNQAFKELNYTYY